MEISAIQTRILTPPKDSFIDALRESLGEVPERSVIALSSKAVAIGEGRCVPISSASEVLAQKRALADAEAEYVVDYPHEQYPRYFTIIHGSLMGSSGIDASNGNGHLILWPEDPMEAARRYRTLIQTHYRVREVGVVITDSHSIPLHNGAVGIAIGYAGFLPLNDYRGSSDLFGRTFKVERANVADSLATAATYVMGEGSESTPAVLMTHVPHITFSDSAPDDPYLDLTVPRADDNFRIFLDSVPWRRGGGGYHI